MPRKALQVNTTTGTIERTPDLVESSEVQTTPTINAIPRAAATGLLNLGWIPVAADGEISDAKLVRADDSRFTSPTVGGDLSGTASSATVIRIQGRAVANIAPSDGDGLIWSHANNRWEPAEVVGGGGGDATSIQGRAVLSTAPVTNDALVWNGTAWTPSPVAGGEEPVGSKLLLFERYT